MESLVSVFAICSAIEQISCSENFSKSITISFLRIGINPALPAFACQFTRSSKLMLTNLFIVTPLRRASSRRLFKTDLSSLRVILSPFSLLFERRKTSLVVLSNVPKLFFCCGIFLDWYYKFEVKKYAIILLHCYHWF
jgi:hypothetical protein